MSWVHTVAVLFVTFISSLSLAAFPRANERFDPEPLQVVRRDGERQSMRISRLDCEAGEVVLFHKEKGHAVDLEDLKTQIMTADGQLRTARFKSIEKFLTYLEAKVVDERENRWTADSQVQGNPRYNCHAFSLGDDIGLSPNDWVKGMDESFVSRDGIVPLPGNPMETLLESYYTEIQRHEFAGKGFKTMLEDMPLHTGDVVVLTGNPETTNGGFPRLQHEISARIVALTGEAKRDLIEYSKSIRVRVKLSESSPLVEMPLNRLLMHSFSFYNEVRFYRLKK